MAIASFKPDVNVQVKPDLPTVQPKDYKSVIYDDDYVPLHSLITYIEGMPWTVTYYSQVLGEHNDLRELDGVQDTVYQQYTKINKLELIVDSDLSSSYDSDTGLMAVSGSAYIHPFIRPNVSDYFVAKAGDNRTAVFRIRSSERRVFNRDSVHYVEYGLVYYTERDPGRLKAMEDRVIRTYYYSKDRVLENLQPLLKTEDYEQISNLRQTYRELAQYYFKTFYNKVYQTMVLPGQPLAVYDYHHLDYLLKIVSPFDADEIKHIRHISLENDPHLDLYQFWDMMFQREYDLRTRGIQKMGILSTGAFHFNSYLRGARYSNIDYVVYPLETDESLYGENKYPAFKTSSPETFTKTYAAHKNNDDSLVETVEIKGRPVPLLYSVTYDDFYVLSQHFYEDDNAMSVLEILTRDYMNNETIDLTLLSILASKYRRWPRMEQYYYGPILLTLIKEANRATYTP